MPGTLDIALMPAEALHMGADCFIVVDVLRATTTVATLFAAGLTDLLVMSDINEARRRAAAEGLLLFGEVHGVKPDGFDYGNSPLEASAAQVRGRAAVLFTTNGTAALCAVAGAGVVATGALANLSTVAQHAYSFERVIVVCAGNGRGQRFSLEDFAAAGAICRAIRDLNPGRHTGDAANLAMGLNTTAAIEGSEHAGIIRKLGFDADIGFACQADTSSAIPVVTAHGDGWALLRDGSLPARSVS